MRQSQRARKEAGGSRQGPEATKMGFDKNELVPDGPKEEKGVNPERAGRKGRKSSFGRTL